VRLTVNVLLGHILVFSFFLFVYFLHFFIIQKCSFNFSVNLFVLVINKIKEIFSFEKKIFISSFLTLFLFFLIVLFCFFGYFIYSFCVCSMLEFTFIVSLFFWLSSFLYTIFSIKLSFVFRKQDESFLKVFLIIFIELIREFSRPIALTVRLTVNVLLGHILVFSFFLFVDIKESII